MTNRLTRSALPLDHGVVALALPTTEATSENLLAELSHIDPDQRPLDHARIAHQIVSRQAAAPRAYRQAQL